MTNIKHKQQGKCIAQDQHDFFPSSPTKSKYSSRSFQPNCRPCWTVRPFANCAQTGTAAWAMATQQTTKSLHKTSELQETATNTISHIKALYISMTKYHLRTGPFSCKRECTSSWQQSTVLPSTSKMVHSPGTMMDCLVAGLQRSYFNHNYNYSDKKHRFTEDTAVQKTKQIKTCTARRTLTWGVFIVLAIRHLRLMKQLILAKVAAQSSGPLTDKPQKVVDVSQL